VVKSRFAIVGAPMLALAACGLAANGLGSSADGGKGTYELDGDVTGSDVSSGGGGSQVDTSVATTNDAEIDSADSSTNDGDAIAPSPADGCVPAGKENCVNGLDDDCNGLTDCEDPACTSQGYACVGAPPSTWTVAPFNATSRPGCPAALPAQDNVDVDPLNLAGVSTCGCNCAVAGAPSCVAGDIVTRYGPDNTCDGEGGAGTPVNYPTADGGCTAQGLFVAPFVFAEGPPPSGGSCTPEGSVIVPSTGATQGQLCGGETMFGAGCGAAQVCALVPSGYTSCILHEGQVSCPSGVYSTPHFVGTLDDTRGCTACTCNTPTGECTPGTWAFFANPNCAGAPSISIPTDGVCTGTGAPPAGTATQSNQFRSVLTDAGCAAAAPVQPTGSVMLTNPDTVCCE
jgi:hypothetical protein